MKFRISKKVCEKIPGIQVTVLIFKNLKNTRMIGAAEQLLRGACAQRKTEWKNEEKYKIVAGILAKTHVDSQTMSEAQLLESTVRKIKRGKPPAGKNNLHALAHYLSIKYLVPLQCRDLDEAEKDIELDFITPKKGKRAQDMEVEKDTTMAAVWFFDVGSQQKEEFKQLPQEFAAVIQKYCGGSEPEVYSLNCHSPEVDLGYESEREREYRAAHPEEPPQENPMEMPVLEAAPEKSMQPSIKEKLVKAIREAALSAGLPEDALLEEVEIEIPGEASYGDYSTNLALKLGKALNRPPRELAETLLKALPAMEEVGKTDIAGPGFINFTLSQNYVQQQLDKIIMEKQHFGRQTFGKNQKIVVEYSSPNIAKPLGVHHLLSTIIGQTIADLCRFAGYDVVSMNWLGDWGTQYGKLLYAYKHWGDKEVVKKDPLGELLKLYVQFHDESEKDPSLQDKGRDEFKKLEEGDEENTKLWNWMRDVSIEELKKVYEQLGVQFDEYWSEGMYVEAARKVIEEGKGKGIFVEGEKGAIIAKFESDQLPPYMVQKADGTTLYSTRDIAGLKDRIEKFHPVRCVYVVDVAQKLHFEQLFETARKFGMDSAELVHVSFGRMQLPEGKMSTRKGDVVLLDELIKEAVSRTEKIVQEKSKEIAAEEQVKIAEGMAIGAIKYNILSQNRETNIIFDWDRMLSLEGNSGPYLQYAYARARSIMRKASETPAVNPNLPRDPQTSLFSVEDDRRAEQEKDAAPLGHPTEQTLLRLLTQFPEKIEWAVREYKPNTISTYLFEVARAFSSFYNEVHVLGAGKPELRESRLKLVEATAQVLKNGLHLLGIQVFERM